MSFVCVNLICSWITSDYVLTVLVFHFLYYLFIHFAYAFIYETYNLQLTQTQAIKEQVTSCLSSKTLGIVTSTYPGF